MSKFKFEEIISDSWAINYRPAKIDDVVLPARIKTIFQEMVRSKNLISMTLAGNKGIGKTTTALALVEELGIPCMFINGSNTGIDDVRTKIVPYAQSKSLQGDVKVIIIDEADKLTSQAQMMLRTVFETYSKVCKFILTCNHPSNIHEAIISRAPIIKFDITRSESKEILHSFLEKFKEILTKEGKEFDEEVLKKVMLKYYPDFRETATRLQLNSLSGKLIFEERDSDVDVLFKNLCETLKLKKFTPFRRAVADILEIIDAQDLTEMLYAKAGDLIIPKSFPAYFVALNDMQVELNTVFIKELCITANLTKIMIDPNIEFS